MTKPIVKVMIKKSQLKELEQTLKRNSPQWVEHCALILIGDMIVKNVFTGDVHTTLEDVELVDTTPVMSNVDRHQQYQESEEFIFIPIHVKNTTRWVFGEI